MKNICTAYTKDHRRCRLEKVGENTCHIHRNYYKNWFVKHPVIGYGDYTGRKLKEVSYQFRNHITITDKMIKDWADMNRILNATNYEFLIVHAHINPLTSLEWLKNATLNIIYSYEWCERLNSILTSPEVCIEVFKHLLLMYDWGIQISWSTVFYPSNWRKILYSPTFMDVYNEHLEKHKKSPDLVLNIQTVIYPQMQEAKKNHRQFLRCLVGLYKEELMMVCWHPSRVENWIKEGGIELADNMMGL